VNLKQGKCKENHTSVQLQKAKDEPEMNQREMVTSHAAEDSMPNTADF
jgi:hypothetical protein